MRFHFDSIAALKPEQARALLPGWLRSYVEGSAAAVAAEAAAAEALLGVEDAALREALEAFAGWGDAYGQHPAHPVARSLTRAYMTPLLAGCEVTGLEHARAAAARAPLWIGNHLSYIDTQVTDCLLHLRGADDVADGVLVVAGPKVYSDPFRRIASMGLNTLKTAQSTTLATSDGAALSAREVAVIAIESVRAAGIWRAERGPVLLYPEGTRSRSGRLGPFLRAAARYTRGAPIIVPLAVTGTERLFGRDERMRPTPCRLAFGAPFDPRDYPGKTGPLDEARRRVAALLPAGHRPTD